MERWFADFVGGGDVGMRQPRGGAGDFGAEHLAETPAQPMQRNFHGAFSHQQVAGGLRASVRSGLADQLAFEHGVFALKKVQAGVRRGTAA